MSLRDRASRTLTYNDEQFHILEKIKMQETIRVLVDLLQKECAPVVAQGRTLPPQSTLSVFFKLELCRFRFLKNPDSDSSAVFGNLSDIATGKGIRKGIILRLTNPQIRNGQNVEGISIHDS